MFLSAFFFFHCTKCPYLFFQEAVWYPTIFILLLALKPNCEFKDLCVSLGPVGLAHITSSVGGVRPNLTLNSFRFWSLVFFFFQHIPALLVQYLYIVWILIDVGTKLRASNSFHDNFVTARGMSQGPKGLLKLCRFSPPCFSFPILLPSICPFIFCQYSV